MHDHSRFQGAIDWRHKCLSFSLSLSLSLCPSLSLLLLTKIHPRTIYQALPLLVFSTCRLQPTCRALGLMTTRVDTFRLAHANVLFAVTRKAVWHGCTELPNYQGGDVSLLNAAPYSLCENFQTGMKPWQSVWLISESAWLTFRLGFPVKSRALESGVVFTCTTLYRALRIQPKNSHNYAQLAFSCTVNPAWSLSWFRLTKTANLTWTWHIGMSHFLADVVGSRYTCYCPSEALT